MKCGDIAKIERFLAMVKQLRPDIDLTLQMLVTDRNIFDVNAVAVTAKTNGIDASFIYPLCFSERQFDELYPKTRHHLSHKTTRGECHEPFRSPLVAINGDVYPCCYIYENRCGDTFQEVLKNGVTFVPQGEYKMGNIFKDDFGEMWASERWMKVRHAVREAKGLTDYNKVRDGVNLCSAPHDYCKICAQGWGWVC